MSIVYETGPEKDPYRFRVEGVRGDGAVWDQWPEHQKDVSVEDFSAGYIAGANRAQEATREQVTEAMLDTPAVDYPGVHFASSNPDDVKDAEGLADALLARFDIREKEQS